MSELAEFAKESLPTPASRWVATATLSITLGLLFLPEIAPKIGLPPIGLPTLLPRLIAATTILSLGSLIILSIIVCYSKSLKQTLTNLQDENVALHTLVSRTKAELQDANEKLHAAQFDIQTNQSRASDVIITGGAGGEHGDGGPVNIIGSSFNAGNANPNA